MFVRTFRIPHMKKAVRTAIVLLAAALLLPIAVLSVRIGRQSQREEARPADVILVLGAAEYRGRPSPVLKARLDHALELYNRKMAPRASYTGLVVGIRYRRRCHGFAGRHALIGAG